MPIYVPLVLFAPYAKKTKQILNIITENQQFRSIIMGTHIVEQMDCDRHILFIIWIRMFSFGYIFYIKHTLTSIQFHISARV